MSLDLYITFEPCSECGHIKEELNFNCTYNLWKMWHKIYPDDDRMVFIDGRSGRNSLPILLHAKSQLLKYPEEFILLEPSNGFGSYSSFCKFIDQLIDACIQYPDNIWYAYR